MLGITNISSLIFPDYTSSCYPKELQEAITSVQNYDCCSEDPDLYYVSTYDLEIDDTDIEL